MKGERPLHQELIWLGRSRENIKTAPNGCRFYIAVSFQNIVLEERIGQESIMYILLSVVVHISLTTLTHSLQKQHRSVLRFPHSVAANTQSKAPRIKIYARNIISLAQVTKALRAVSTCCPSALVFLLGKRKHRLRFTKLKNSAQALFFLTLSAH